MEKNPSLAEVAPSHAHRNGQFQGVGHVVVGYRAILGQRRHELPILAIALVAFLLRVWPAFRPGLFWTASVNPYDATGYIQLAEGLAHGCGFARWTNSSCSAPEILRVPGYPGFVAMLGNLRLVVIVQSAAGALICILLAAFAYRRWGLNVALAAEIAFAADTPSLVWTSQIMTESLFQLLATAAVLLELAVIESTNSRRQLLGSLGVAVLLALSLMVKSIAQLSVPFAAIALLLAPRRWRIRLLCAGLVVLIPAAVVAGWTSRNVLRTGAPVYALEEAEDLYLFKAAGILAYTEHRNFAEVQQVLWSRLGLPADINLKVSGPVSPLQGRSATPMIKRGKQIIERHPVVFLIVTAKSLTYLAWTPGLQDLKVWLEPSLSQVNESGSPSLVSGALVKSKLKGLLTSPRPVQAIVLACWILLALAWAGVARAMWKIWLRTIPHMLPVLLPFCVAVTLMLAASGQEGGARLRVPAMPLLYLVASIGWFGKRKTLAAQR